MCVVRQHSDSTDESDSRLAEKNLSGMPIYHEDTKQIDWKLIGGRCSTNSSTVVFLGATK